MEHQSVVLAKVRHARQVETVLQWLGWLVGVIGLAGMIMFTLLWAAGALSVEQGLSLVLGTTLATFLSGATAYAAAINIGLGAERLDLAAKAAGIDQPAQGSAGPDSAASHEQGS